MAQTQALLDEIAKLQAAQDAAALLGLEDHEDKKVRKAARKAIHVLRSKGVEIPETAKTWAGASLDGLRRHGGPIAMIDMSASPGLSRVTLSLPNDEEGAALFVAILDPEDRLLDFGAYYQTDGQQGRTARDWQRDADGRMVDVDWIRARLRWAREATFQAGREVPSGFDDHLPRLGDAPEAHPEPTWLDAALADVAAAEGELQDVMLGARVHEWPVLFDANNFFEVLNERMKDVDPQALEDAQRTEHIEGAAAGDEGLREGLRGPLANALDDAAVVLWLDGSLGEARRIRDLATALRGAEAPETVDGVTTLVQMQITSAAMEQLRRGGGMQGQDYDDHDLDHDQGHDN
ncbi:hypothetical protein G6O69_30635 [Pseudenhygromyxa sp. WMMC2535]|uniref:hypothetical protein n=1 Tax=Pseudenhygromyxa sp. WMMC2535 TaxID=2712867 RepID=UPI00155439D0|nr:hypothetical protein [Pseudenhygromyxa sp. WMMC2535]NVB42220.1 hypothetical protein [Pseudenhygromyxa sp. WMMC2535]